MLATCGPAYRATHALSSAQAKVWRAIVSCRTAALGGQVESCTACHATRYVYHSCRNRHCPQCQTRAKEAWIAARRGELLPVPYFHLVFTLPHALHGLVGWHARLIYELLFASASATLTEFGLLGPAHKTAHLTMARVALDAPAPEPAVIESVTKFMQRVARIEWGHCPLCQRGQFAVIEAIPRAPRCQSMHDPA